MKSILAGPLVASLLAAQDPPPVLVRRIPPPADYEKAAQMLAGGGSPAPGNSKASTRPHESRPMGTVKGSPGSNPNKEIPLDDSARKALAIANDYVHRPSLPVAGPDGRVLYTYGDGLATVVCAVLHACTVELEQDEILRTFQQVDKTWDVHPFAQEQDGHLQTTVTLIPHRLGSDVSLVIRTDRRDYDLRLISDAQDFMPRVGFTYPGSDDALRDYQQQVSQIKTKLEPLPRALPDMKPVEITYTKGYDVRGKKSFWRHEQHPWFWPDDIRDDGKFVEITLPKAVQNVRAPILMAVGPKGFEPLNYDTQGNRFITRSLFHEAALVSGTGRKAKIVYITSPRGETK